VIRSLFPAAPRNRLLQSKEPWTPFPPASDRAAWNGLTAADRAVLLAAGEARRGFAWPFLPATECMAYVRDGNRSRYEAPYMARRAALVDLVLAECVEGGGRFLDDITSGVWAVCEESSWSLPAHLERPPGNGGLPDVQRPVVDLFAAETAALLAWTDFLLGPQLAAVSAFLAARPRDEIARRVLDPALQRDDFWWMGIRNLHGHLNNWTPWIVSNWLACILLLERDPARRAASLGKAMDCLDRFLAPYPADGGCDEGPMYWTRAAASLFDGLEWLHSATKGDLNLFDQPLVREMGRFIARVQIADLWFVNFADAGPRVSPPPAIVYGFGVRTGDADLQSLGAWLGRRIPRAAAGRGESIGRLLQGLFAFRIPAPPDHPPLPRDAWLPVIEVMAARDKAGSPDGWFVAAKGGHNAESHNHNDIGAFLVYRDGAPLLVDAGVGEYTRKTFSRERYTIWTMQSAWHNLLPTCDGVLQSPGREFASRHAAWQADDASASLSLEIQAAYPPSAGLARWSRTVRLERGRRVVVEDDFALDRDLNAIELSLLSPSQPTVTGPDTIRFEGRHLPGGLRSASGTVRLGGAAVSLAVESVPLSDSRLTPVWGEALHRVVVRLSRPPRTGRLVTEVLP
jgi:hypothetical protein